MKTISPKQIELKNKLLLQGYKLQKDVIDMIVLVKRNITIKIA